VFPLEEFRESLTRLVDILRTCRIRFYLTGGGAAVAYGDPRMTQDMDLVVEGASLAECLPAFLVLLERNQFLFNETTIRDALANSRQFQLIDIDLALKFDLYPTDLVPGAIERAVEMEVYPQFRLPVASRVDLAISKLIWIGKGSSKSRRDLKQILLRASAEETAGVRELAAKLSLEALLDEVLAEPDEIDA
jgi:hypothetical protein